MHKKKTLFSLITILVSGIILLSASFLTSLASTVSAQIVETPTINYTIVIDPGHGFPDPGSIGKNSKVKESDLNLVVSSLLADKLRKVGINVVLTRTDENGLYGLYSTTYKKRDMAKRKEIINDVKPNMVVSVHMNSFTNTKLRGAQVFYDKSSEISRELALSIQNFFTSELPASDKGVSVGDYFMLKCTDAPSVICECGFLSNPEDEKLLLSPDYQEKVANCIFRGIISFINI
ncbi:MAG: N-acetylmuramoyl-L-alanine amidase [Clostridia bacterium]|nr:N-acetylmuramoyl-L-alanine amidase [Clostridia bacterium]